MAVFLRRFVVSHHSQELQKRIEGGSLRLLDNATSRCLSSRGKPPVAPPTMNRAGRGFQSFRDRRAERTRQSNAAGGWIVFSVAMAGGTISAVVMAYTEGAQSPVQQQLHTDSSSASFLSVGQFLDQGRFLQGDRGDDSKNKTVHKKIQQLNVVNSLDFDDYILDDGYELLPPTTVTRHQLLRQTIEEIESSVALETADPGNAGVRDVSRGLDQLVIATGKQLVPFNFGMKTRTLFCNG